MPAWRAEVASKRWALLASWMAASLASAAPCPKLVVVLDPRISADVLERSWQTGQPRDEAPAVLELRGCHDELLDRRVLASSLARLDPVPLRGVVPATYLVSVDLTAPIGSYSGPATTAFSFADRHLHTSVARTTDGRTEPLRLAATGKAAWQRWPTNRRDDVLSVSCQPRDDGFVVIYRRYETTGVVWRVHTRTEAGLRESDADFPARRLFP